MLLTQRPEGKSLAGLWEFPGGKIELGETPEHALARELHEELGILVEPAALEPLGFASHGYGQFHLVMLLYGARTWAGEAVGQEAQALCWAGHARLSALPMPPADVPLLALLQPLIAA